MDKEKLADAFNEWMRRYTNDPAGFEAEFETVSDFLKDERNGDVPDYGHACVSYLGTVMKELAWRRFEKGADVVGVRLRKIIDEARNHGETPAETFHRLMAVAPPVDTTKPEFTR